MVQLMQKKFAVATVLAILFFAALVRGSTGDEDTQPAESDFFCKVPIVTYTAILVGGFLVLVMLIGCAVSYLHHKRDTYRRSATVRERKDELLTVENLRSSLKELKQHVDEQKRDFSQQLDDVKRKSKENKEKRASFKTGGTGKKEDGIEENLSKAEETLEIEEGKLDEALNRINKMLHLINVMTDKVINRQSKVQTLLEQDETLPGPKASAEYGALHSSDVP